MKKRMLIVISMSLLFNTMNCFAAGKTVEAFKNNVYPKKELSDCQEMINGIKSKVPAYKDRMKGPKDATPITITDFKRRAKAIKYWASHGSNAGRLYGDNGIDINVMNISNFKWSGGKLEFVFLAACYQLDGSNKNPRAKYAKAMLGSKAVRVICGYHDKAPKAGAKEDAAVARNFIAKAKTGESVKSSWIQANQMQGNPFYCVLTHAGDVQYSRFEGFPGATYRRPDAASKKILRFSAANPNGTTQPLAKSLRTALNIKNIPNYSIKAVNRDIKVDSKIKTTVLKVDDYLTTQNNEINDKEINILDNQVKDIAEKWLNNTYAGVGMDDFKNSKIRINPIVMAEVDLDGNVENEKEICVAYDISYNTTFAGIPVAGDKYCAIVDENGVISSAVSHRDYEIIRNEEPIDVRKLLKSNNIEKQILNNGIEMNTKVENVEIEFKDDDGDGIFNPTVELYLPNQKRIDINCTTQNVTMSEEVLNESN